MKYFLYVTLFIPLTVCELAGEPSFLERFKRESKQNSKYLKDGGHSPKFVGEIKADIEGYKKQIEPIFQNTCVQCHGPNKEKGDFRIDTLDPDMITGSDVDWWLEVIEVLTNNEMPPPEKDVVLSDEDRAKAIDWLSDQVLLASQVERSEGGHSSFRRMTRYEYSYALQDLLGLQRDLGKDLPQESLSEDGFRNSSERMEMTSQQFSIYREIAQKALASAVYRDKDAKPVYFSAKMEAGGEPFIDWVSTRATKFRALKEEGEAVHTLPSEFMRALKHAKTSVLNRQKTYFLNIETGEGWNRNVPEGFRLWEPSFEKPEDPPAQSHVMVLPVRQSYVFDVATSMPDHGKVKVRVRASRANEASEGYPSLSLVWGHDPDKTHSQTIDFKVHEHPVKAAPGCPEFYEWIVSLDGLKRNPFLRTGQLHRMTHPTEQFILKNSYQGEDSSNSVIIDYVEISTLKQTWPSKSYLTLFPERLMTGDENNDAQALAKEFMRKAWRRPIEDSEVERIYKLFKTMRPAYENFENAMLEVYATILTSSHFLYLSQSEEAVSPSELASRLSFFLWGSIPDEELLSLVEDGTIKDPVVIRKQAERMLKNPKVDRFIGQFTHQWLGLEMLESLKLDEKEFPQFSEDLKKSMFKEPIVLFKHMLEEDATIMDFLHSDYSYIDQKLAQHYGIEGVYGNHFRRVEFSSELNRGGLLAQAGLLSMNSDGKDSHPLRRSMWILENLLHDSPPPPPAAVPEIDLTDPRILEMTLKERMEDHRDKPACASCHMKIDPWGLSLEEFDAIGAWRVEIDGEPVDASSKLVDDTEIVGVEGLKKYLLGHRQDHFAKAMVEKLACYALGRPLSFSDHAEIERITAETRKSGDGLKTLILLLVESDLFRNT